MGLGASMVTLLMWFISCTSVHTLNGSKTLEPDTWEFAVGTSVQNNNYLSAALGIPVPQMVVAARYGLEENLDIGIQTYLGGGVLDFRTQFAEYNDWYFAIAPGIGGLYGGVLGNVDLRLPIRVEKKLSSKWSTVFGVTPLTQHSFVWLPMANETLVQAYIGGSTRLVRHYEKINIGYSFDVLHNTGRSVLPSWSVGVDCSFKR